MLHQQLVGQRGRKSGGNLVLAKQKPEVLQL